MCTIVLLRRPGHDWPLILGANRDEMATRPSKPPARHWPDRAEVVAGLDVEAGGSWLGILTAFHAQRRRDVESGRRPTIKESLAAMQAGD